MAAVAPPNRRNECVKVRNDTAQKTAVLLFGGLLFFCAVKRVWNGGKLLNRSSRPVIKFRVNLLEQPNGTKRITGLRPIFTNFIMYLSCLKNLVFYYL